MEHPDCQVRVEIVCVGVRTLLAVSVAIYMKITGPANQLV